MGFLNFSQLRIGRSYLRGNKTAYILCTLFCVLLALACIVYIGLTLLFVDAVQNQPPSSYQRYSIPSPGLK